MRDNISGRDIAIAAGGIAVGLIGSRLLAPFVAMGAGAMRSRTSGDPFDKLEQDHRVILKTLHTMEQMQDRSRGKRTSLFLMLKRKLAKHALAE